MKNNDFDTKGFLFFAKFFLILILLGGSVYFATDKFFTKSWKDILLANQYDKRLDLLEENRIKEMEDKLKELEGIQTKTHVLDPQSINDYNQDELIPQEGKFVVADLDQMYLYLYEDKEILNSFNILSKGRDGSRWETPSGIYSIQTKEQNHFSSIGHVYMPYSMQFFGNFFIHGWPYYEDGTPVPQSHSGGCIRLSTESARQVFNFVDKGTDVFILDKTKPADEKLTNIKIKNIPLPDISAQAAIVANINNNEVYYKKNSDVYRPIASITKLITAITANETISYDKKITIDVVPERTGDYSGNIKNGDVFYSEELLYPLLMESNNSVAHSFSGYYGDNAFIGWMNDKVKALGMLDTRLSDSSGISPENISTADDLFKLAKYLYEKQSYTLNITRSGDKEMESLNGTDYIFHNFNEFSTNENFVGGKTGFTNAAQETMLSIFDTKIDDAEPTVVIVVLGSQDREKDTETLLSWFLNSATTQTN